MDEIRLGSPAEWSTAEWHAPRAAVDHLTERAHAPRMQRAAELAVHLADELGVETVIDVGAGAAGVLRLVQLARPTLNLIGYEWHLGNRALADERYGIHLVGADVVHLAAHGALVSTFGDVSAVVIATELLEHLEDPHEFLAAMHDDPKIAGLVCSSPWNENATHYSEGHRWAWSPAGYVALVEGAGFRVLEHELVEWSQLLIAVSSHPSVEEPF